MDIPSDLRNYEMLMQENVSLKYKVNDLMERNLALQKTIASSGKEVAAVHYVENVTLRSFNFFFKFRIFDQQECFFVIKTGVWSLL